MEAFETHPRGTAKVLEELRAEREALKVQCTEQRALLEQAKGDLQWINLRSNMARMIDEYLKGTQ